MTKQSEPAHINERANIVARLFRGGGFSLYTRIVAVAQKTPASEEAGYNNISIPRILRGAQIQKQFRLAQLLLCAVGEALHRKDSGRQFIIAHDDSVARLQPIRKTQRLPELHLDCRQLDNETRIA